MAFPTLRWFKRNEFKNPDLMNTAFLLWLDLVRDRSGVSFVITDDARLPGDAPSGASATSLHYRGRAVDVRSRNWTAAQKWRVMEAMAFYSNQAPGKVEWEPVFNADETGDKHWHIGVDEKATAHQLIEADD